MPLLILRSFFILASSGIGVAIVRGGVIGSSAGGLTTFVLLVILALAVVGLDMAFPKKKIAWISAYYFGLLIGLITTYIMGLALEPFFEENVGEAAGSGDAAALTLRQGVTATLLLIFSYCGISFLLQTRNDFRFIIPFVEFQRSIKGVKPLILDTSVVIDGRIADVMETKLVDSPLLMPRFAIVELQHIADSSDRSRRIRGRRGLDVLNRLQNMPGVDLQIELLVLRAHARRLRWPCLCCRIRGR